MFELFRFKRALERKGYQTRWKAWKTFSVSKYNEKFATALRDIDNELMYSFDSPKEPYELETRAMARERGFILDGPSS